MAKLEIPQSKINTMQIEAEKYNGLYDSMINLSNEELIAITQGPIQNLNSHDHTFSCILCHDILTGSELFTSVENGD